MDRRVLLAGVGGLAAWTALRPSAPPRPRTGRPSCSGTRCRGRTAKRSTGSRGTSTRASPNSRWRRCSRAPTRRDADRGHRRLPRRQGAEHRPDFRGRHGDDAAGGPCHQAGLEACGGDGLRPRPQELHPWRARLLQPTRRQARLDAVQLLDGGHVVQPRRLREGGARPGQAAGDLRRLRQGRPHPRVEGPDADRQHHGLDDLDPVRGIRRDPETSPTRPERRLRRVGAELLINTKPFVDQLQRFMDLSKDGAFKYTGRDTAPDAVFYSGRRPSGSARPRAAPTS